MNMLLIGGVGMLLPFAAASLADDLKPLDTKLGLWETTIDTAGMPAMVMPQIPKETLDKMPAAQRAQVEAMMKNQAGGSGKRTATTKSCTTKESQSRGYGMPESKEATCKRQIVSSTSSKTELHMVCTSSTGATKSESDILMERIDSEHVRGSVTSKTSVRDSPITVKIAINSKWLSSDCGDVKPLIAK